MSRFDKAVPRVVPAAESAPLKVGKAVLGRIEKREGTWTWCGQRLSEIEALIDFRSGVEDETAAAEYLWAARWCLLWVGARPKRPAHHASLTTWARMFAADLFETRSAEWWDVVEADARAQERCPYRRADSIANLLKVTWEERLTLGLKTIGAIDMNKRQRLAIRRRANAEHQRTKRQKLGATPRKEAKSERKPWKKLGIGRTTYYELAAAGLLEVEENGTPRTSSSATLKGVARTNSSASFFGPRTSSSAVVSVGDVEHRRTCPATETDRHAETPTETLAGNTTSAAAKRGRRQAGPTSDAASTSPIETPERKRSDPCGWALAQRPAGEAARPARASNPPPAPTPKEPDELRVGLAPTSPAQPNDGSSRSNAKLEAACERWTVGPMPEIVWLAFTAAKRRQGLKQATLAAALGVDPRDLARVDRYGTRLRPAVITALKAWVVEHQQPGGVDTFAGLRGPQAQKEWEARSASATDQLSLRLLRSLDQPRVADVPRKSRRPRREPATIYGLPSGRERNFGYVDFNGRTVGMVSKDPFGWRAIYRGREVGHYPSRKDAVEAVQLKASSALAEVG